MISTAEWVQQNFNRGINMQPGDYEIYFSICMNRYGYGLY